MRPKHIFYSLFLQVIFRLHYVHLRRSYLKISRDGFGWVAEGVKKSLSHLDLSHCPGVDDGVLALLGEHVRTLEELQLVRL